MTAQADVDRHFLNYAIKVGRRGLGTTAPNPSVGAVVVAQNDDGHAVIVGEGTTAPGGRPHAEPQALQMAGEQARSATLYVSLEPCSHYGKTPPCTDAIIAAGISRVVCELSDVHPNVSECGFERLREAGIAVDLLVPATPEAVFAHAGHILCVRNQRPFIQLKVAVSKDGRIAPGDGAPVWVTGPQARVRGHLLRAQADAILVGAGTVRADDPELTCRLPGLRTRSPLPVILDTHLSVAAGARCIAEAQGRAVVFTSVTDANGAFDSIIVDTVSDGCLDPAQIVRELGARGITRLLVEGGPTVCGTFLADGVVDEVVVFRGAEQLEGTGLQPFGDRGLDILECRVDWDESPTIQVGLDTLTVYRRAGLGEELLGT